MSSTARVVQELPVEIADPSSATSIEPELLADESACQERQDVRACARAAEYWGGDNGQPFDPKRAFRHAASGCAGGDGRACAILGSHYENGFGIAWSPARAVQIYELSCKAGTGLSCARLGAMYDRGHGVDVDRAKASAYKDRAHEQWLAACLGDEPRSCPHAASATREDEPTADELYRRACDQGVADACIQALHDRLTGPKGSLDATMRELDGWCSRGRSSACESLALAYAAPDGPADPRRSADLTRRACVLGATSACVTLGVLHEVERGVPKDDAGARRYFRRACDRGSSLGCLYLAQDMVVASAPARDIADTARRGCEMGNTQACDLLTKISLAIADEPAVVRWATEACRRGSGHGCRRLVALDIELPKAITDPEQHYRDACRAKISSACLRLPRLVQAKNDLLRAFAAAVTAQDPAAFARLAANEVMLHHLQFDDPDCATRFSDAALGEEQHGAFLRCLAKPGVRVEPPSDPMSTHSLVYGPDLKLTVSVRDGTVERISGPPSQRPPGAPPPHAPVAADGAPRNVAPIAIEAHRIVGDKYIAPDPQTKAAIAAAGNPRLFGSFKLCLTEFGTIAHVTMLQSTGFIAYDRTLARTMHGWRYRPVVVDGVPAKVCTAVTFVYTQSFPVGRQRRP